MAHSAWAREAKREMVGSAVEAGEPREDVCMSVAK
jgi:hypothetical protein